MTDIDRTYTVIDVSNLTNLKESQISYRTQNTYSNQSYSNIQNNLQYSSDNSDNSYSSNSLNNTNESNGLVMNVYNFLKRYISIISRIGNYDETHCV
jgi:hypothetical protein